MKERIERTIPQEIGDLTQQLTHPLHHLERALEAVRQAAESMTGLDVRFRMVSQASAALLGGGSQEAAAAPEAGAAQSKDLAGLLYRVGQAMIDGVNQQAKAGATDEADAEASRLRAAVTRLRTTRLEPFRQAVADSLDNLFSLLKYESDPDFRPPVDRFADLRQQLDRFAAQVGQMEGGDGVARAWPGELDLPEPGAGELVEPRDVGGRLVPQIRPEAVALLIEEINRQIASALEKPAGGQTAAEGEHGRLEKLERSFFELLERALDLRHSVREAVNRKKQSGAEVPAPAQEILKELKALLESYDVEEMEIEPGERVNERLHKVVAHEANSRYRSGEIVRVMVPGFHYQGKAARRAQVVATP